MRYRLYVDESGCPNPVSEDEEDIGRRYLGLGGVMVHEDGERYRLHERMEELKRKHLPFDPDEDPVILHLADIVGCRGPFKVLATPTKWSAFQDDLLHLIDETSFVAMVVVIDKATHGVKKYRSLQHPYHYCLHALMERYCGLLDHKGAVGDVMAESRGGKHDRQLADEYRGVYRYGTNFLNSGVAKKVLTTKELKIKAKDRNIAGLQLADLVALPLVRDTLSVRGKLSIPLTGLRKGIAEVASRKYNCQLYTGRVDGYGRVFLA